MKLKLLLTLLVFSFFLCSHIQAEEKAKKGYLAYGFNSSDIKQLHMLNLAIFRSKITIVSHGKPGYGECQRSMPKKELLIFTCGPAPYVFKAITSSYYSTVSSSGELRDTDLSMLVERSEVLLEDVDPCANTGCTNKKHPGAKPCYRDYDEGGTAGCYYYDKDDVYYNYHEHVCK